MNTQINEGHRIREDVLTRNGALLGFNTRRFQRWRAHNKGFLAAAFGEGEAQRYLTICDSHLEDDQLNPPEHDIETLSHELYAEISYLEDLDRRLSVKNSYYGETSLYGSVLHRLGGRTRQSLGGTSLLYDQSRVRHDLTGQISIGRAIAGSINDPIFASRLDQWRRDNCGLLRVAFRGQEILGTYVKLSDQIRGEAQTRDRNCLQLEMELGYLEGLCQRPDLQPDRSRIHWRTDSDGKESIDVDVQPSTPYQLIESLKQLADIRDAQLDRAVQQSLLDNVAIIVEVVKRLEPGQPKPPDDERLSLFDRATKAAEVITRLITTGEVAAAWSFLRERVEEVLRLLT